MDSENQEIAENIYQDATECFATTNYRNYYSEYYPSQRIPSILIKLSRLSRGQWISSAAKEPPCLLNMLMCVWPPRDHKRIVCQRHNSMKEPVEQELIDQ